jgi:molecular chaperone DnaJ
MSRSPYEVLGVAKTATDDEIKKAYRRLARENHPDANQGDAAAEERFKEIQGAYDTLSDPDKRRQYDTFGANGRGASGFGSAPGGGPGGFAYENVDLSDLLGQFGGIFGRGGGRRARPQPERGADLESRVMLSFEDALNGAQVRVPVEADAACHTCHGTGAEPGTSPVMCPRCGGTGTISESQGLFALSQPCPRCRGNGVIVEKPCKTCHGTGTERVTRRYAVKIPAGARDGTRVRLKGKGEPGRNGGPPGDLFVVASVEPSPLYERRGADLVLDVPVTYPEAALGATVEIPTPDGPVNLKVPAGTESGRLLRVKGRGAPKLKGGGRGDLLARVKVTVPQKLTKVEKEALEGFDRVLRERPRDRAFHG